MPPKPMNEFDLIERYFAPLAGPEGLRLKDDTSRFTPKPGFDILITTDSFVERVHFPNNMYGADVAERLLRTNLSDIAVKGGVPIGYQLSVSMPAEKMEQWIPAFAKGLETTQAEFGCTLWGGDTTVIDGPAVFSITLIGEVPEGEMVQRAGAALGDDIWVSGVLGNGKLGCDLVTNQPIQPAPKGEHLFEFESAYWRPEPAFAYKNILANFASAAADISDGVMADVAHISKLSGTCATLNFDALPFSLGAESWADAQKDSMKSRQSLASFGDDYGVVFTAKVESRQAIFDAARKAKLKLTLIGSLLAGQGSVCLDVDGQEMAWPHKGYRHK
ncbi:MAG: thiamine-phosphate kinase [Litorimonas sp.]